jgi:hypothetical protein
MAMVKTAQESSEEEHGTLRPGTGSDAITNDVSICNPALVVLIQSHASSPYKGNSSKEDRNGTHHESGCLKNPNEIGLTVRDVLQKGSVKQANVRMKKFDIILQIFNCLAARNIIMTRARDLAIDAACNFR